MEGNSRFSLPDKLALVFVVVYDIFIYRYLSLLQHLPGPLYGGDLYAHHGFSLNYMMNGFWSDPFFVNNYAFYPWLGNYISILFHYISGLSLMDAMIYTPLITTPVSFFAYYLLGSQLFKSKSWGFVFALIPTLQRGIVDGAPNLSPWMIWWPFMFYFWLRARENNLLRDKILAGVFLGTAALSHVAGFLAGMGLVGATFLYDLLHDRSKANFVVQIKHYFPILFVGFLVSLLFYGPIIWVYKANSLNPLFQYNGMDINLLGLGWWLGAVKSQFWVTNHWSFFIVGIIALLGLVVSVSNWNNRIARIGLLWYVGGVLPPIHHLITRPLFDRWVLPSHLFGTGVAFTIFVIIGMQTLLKLVEGFKLSNVKFGAIIILVVISGGMVSNRIEGYDNDRWTQYGRQLDGVTQAWHEVGKWVQDNTDNNAVFLSGDESCFALHGVSGRKCVIVRRTHANYFVDIDERMADAVVMLYGNDEKKLKELEDKYSVEYLAVDGYMLQSVLLVRPKYKDYLLKYNVSFSEVRERLDPAVAEAAKFDLLAVPPQPLSKALQSQAKNAVSFNVNGQPYIQIFRVV